MKKMNYRPGFFALVVALITFAANAQTGRIEGYITHEGEALPAVSVRIVQLKTGTVSDSSGFYTIENLPYGEYEIEISNSGYQLHRRQIQIGPTVLQLNVALKEKLSALDEVVVTGTMKEISRSESPVPVEIITPKLFQKNPTPSLFEAVGIINGVQPQLNCNVCNTGDIHINGMEGPYTMILIDGMPIVSALSTVYGLSGIPNSIVERIEIVKGPASSLYGSESMGGTINVITKNPLKAPRLSLDFFATSWKEFSADAAVKWKAGKATSLAGINFFTYQNPLDKNGDNFTDVTLQHRISFFNKWSLQRQHGRIATIGLRYVYENRWGGEMQWSNKWRGTDSIYGESIYTKRAEFISLYQLPLKEKIYVQASYNWHQQNSVYGTIPYIATQQVTFLQAYWDKKLSDKHFFLAGTSLRYTYYDDNTPATALPYSGKNNPAKTALPGLFVQDEWMVNNKHKFLLGYRYDYDKNHGSVHSPRLAYKFSPSPHHTVRASFGTGFRVVNLFTEDHAALTGAREVVIAEELRSERSFNGNLNYVLKCGGENVSATFDVTGFYSYFTNKISGDFDTDPTKIIYDNLKGFAVSKGISLNTDLVFSFPLKLLAGITYMNVYQKEEGLPRIQQLHAPKWSGNAVVSYVVAKHWVADLTGKWNGPMRLPILPNDYRPEYSPWHAIANLQLTKKFSGFEVYGGIKNLFNFIPAAPIMRPFDPFNKQAADVVTNPYGYTFDPSYNYASLQGMRGFAGVRMNLR